MFKVFVLIIFLTHFFVIFELLREPLQMDKYIYIYIYFTYFS
mgnify:CR=1 FL=1